MKKKVNIEKYITKKTTSINNKRIIPIFVVIMTFLIVLVSVGYASLNQSLTISGEAFMRAKDNVRISKIDVSNTDNSGYETYSPEYSKKTTKVYSTLPKENSTVTYTVKLTNSTGIKYKIDSIEITNTNPNVSCTPSITKDYIIEDEVTEFTILVNYKDEINTNTNLDVCDIKYEFSPLDVTPPILTVQLVKDSGNIKTIKITATDEADGSGLSPDNVYKYYLSTSKTSLTGGEWNTYVNDTSFDITGEDEAKYLWIYPVKDRAGNLSDGQTNVNIPYLKEQYVFIENTQILYNVLLKETLMEGVAKLYTGNHSDSYNETGTENIYYFNGTTEDEANEVLSKNNVLFAGFCWQMIRTTDTGGVKLVYNGIPKVVDGKNTCTNSGTEQQIGTSSFNKKIESPAYVGYMYNTVYQYKFKTMTSSDVYKYSKSFTYSNGTYKLSSDAIDIDVTNNTEKTKLNNAHYTCLNTTGECETISYVYLLSGNISYYIELQDGKSVEEALQEMVSVDNVNKENSTIKDVVDTWYANNMTEYTDYLEDTVFCNDRSIIDYAGWNPDGGNAANNLLFKYYNTPTGDLYCTNITDRFSTENDKAKLTYPVGLETIEEIYLLGRNNISGTGQWYWLLTPYAFFSNFSFNRYVADTGYTTNVINVSYGGGVRPSVSLKPNTRYATGTGSTTDPYIVDLNAPTVTQETIIDGEREKTVRITVSDDYGLSSENKYQYYLSTSETELAGGEWKDYTSGEIFTITGENETRYLWIYPVMDSAGNINDGKTDVNVPYVLETITFKDRNTLYRLLQKEALSGSGLAKLYTGEHSDTYNETGKENIYYFYGANDTTAASVLNKNNVLFGGFCWQMVRTTDTGGTKLIYNGTPKEVETTQALEENEGTMEDEHQTYSYDSESKKWSSTFTYSGPSRAEVYFIIPTSGEYYLNVNLTKAAPPSGTITGHNVFFEKYIVDDMSFTSIATYREQASVRVNLGYLEENTVIRIFESYTVTAAGGGPGGGGSGGGSSSGSSGETDTTEYDDITSFSFSFERVVETKTVCENSGEEQQIGTSAFNTNRNSPAYVGYMYNTIYPYDNRSMSSSQVYKYAKSFTYSNEMYKLSSDAISIDVTDSTENTKLNNAHYTCFNTTGECNAVYYIYYLKETTIDNALYYTSYYIELKDGKSIENALNEMFSADNVNETNSTIKNTIDTWYANNMTSYTEYLEDTVFCNDRSIYDYGGWNWDGGSVSKYLYFNVQNYTTGNLYCTNITDRFSVGNEKAKLTYPVGLMSTTEMYLLGNVGNIRKTGRWYWLASPNGFHYFYAGGRIVDTSGYVSVINEVSGIGDVRPSVSLAPDTQYATGTGSKTDPYIIP